MDLALLVLRLAVGLFFIGHGSQKLWGWFGGHGPDATGQFFEAIGIRPGRINALAAGWSEFLGGVLLAFGLLSPVAALLIVSVMTTAIITVHAKNGPWVTANGYEYNAVLMAAAFVVAANPGGWSLDAAFGLDALHGTAMAVGALVLGAVGGVVATAAGRAGQPDEPPAPAPIADDAVDREGRITRDVPANTGD
ncbi:MAG: putative oxidoreductase [Solirubrobacteraceae bacterium]|nr:putative oxidoreductase [Solirubrobacteraceae bacterium]